MIVDIIKDVVDKMKVYKTESMGQTTPTTITFRVSAIDYPTWYVGATAYVVISGGDVVYGKAIGIFPIQSIVQVEFTEAVPASSINEFGMDINYLYGHPKDIFNEITKMGQKAAFKTRRFPVLALMQDFDENENEGINEVDIQLIIGTDTLPSYNARQRYEASYNGRRLTLLYQRFIQYMEWNTATYFRRGDAVKTDRLYWGKDGALGNTENKADAFIDAIEININPLKVLNTC